MAKKFKFDVAKEIRAIARERVGTVRPGRAIATKIDRQPKHKKPLGDD